jgi:type 1 glutamine amidotransferase
MAAGKTMSRRVLLGGVLLFLVGCVCWCGESAGAKRGDRIKVVVVTGGHGFKKEAFLALFQGYDDIKCVEARQQDHSEIFEDISGWDYDVMVLYNMTQEISPKRQKNFIELLNRGVGLVALHHSIGAFQQWPEYRKIIGGKYYLKEMEEDGVSHQKSGYKHDVDLPVHVEGAEHPITREMDDFVIHDEAYKKCVFEKDNLVLLSTKHPASDKSLGWVRRYGKANVCYLQLGHGPEAYANANYRRLVCRATRWCSGRLK